MKKRIALLVDTKTARRLDELAERYGKTRQWIVRIACEAVAELADDTSGHARPPDGGRGTKNSPGVCREEC